MMVISSMTLQTFSNNFIETQMAANFHMFGLLLCICVHFSFSNRNVCLIFLEFNSFLDVNSSQGFDGVWGCISPDSIKW